MTANCTLYILKKSGDFESSWTSFRYPFLDRCALRLIFGKSSIHFLYLFFSFFLHSCYMSQSSSSSGSDICTNNTSHQEFGTRKVYFVSNVTFHAESKYAIKIFPSPTVFVQWPFKLLIFRNFWYFHQWFFYTWTNILNGFEQRVVTYNLPLSYL